jgi:intein/homing endonuclease
MSIKSLQEYTFTSKYARYLPEKKRRETWSEAIDRVKDMHIRKYPQIKEEIEWAFEQSRQKRVLGSQRALQFGGKPIENKNARIYNCFSKETQFITSQGVKSFSEFKDGDKISVLTHKGNYKNAVVRCYGENDLYKIQISRSGHNNVVFATRDHRWIMKDGTINNHLEEGDSLATPPSFFSNFNYEESSPLVRIYWCYGYIYGNGFVYKNSKGIPQRSGVKISKENSEYEKRFLENGFCSSGFSSKEDTAIVVAGTYLKNVLCEKLDCPNLVRSFVSGYLASFETKSKENYKNSYDSITVTGEESINFIRKFFPIAGVYIASETELDSHCDNSTDKTIKFNIISNFEKTSKPFNVTNIEFSHRGETWCLEVEDDQSFVLSSGIPTGNCIASYCDRIRFFQECFWLLLCGCGTGFSVQKHHIDKIPDFSESWISKNPEEKEKKVFVIPDSIEGWADSLGVLMSGFLGGGDFPEYEGYWVEFDYSLIRPEGAILNSSSGKAPGSKPLKNAIEKIRNLILNCLKNGQSRIRPIDAYDIVMHASDAVLSGGVRRSATICLFSHDDKEMATAKTGNWFIDNPQRGRSNNSAILIRNETTKEQFNDLMNYVKEFGEPGFVWADSTELVVNPCLTKESLISTKKGLKTVESLINKKFIACVDGQFFESTEKGFWKTGEKSVMCLEFESGRILRCTENHQIMTTSGWKQAHEITSEDSVIINNHRSLNHTINTNSADYAKGYCLGSFIGDSNVYKINEEMEWLGLGKHEQRQYSLNLLEKTGRSNSCNKANDENASVYACLKSKNLFDFEESLDCTVEEKQLTEKIIEGSWSYLSGLLAGYFDTNGTIEVNHNKEFSLRINSKNQNSLRLLQIVLNSFGVFSKIYKDRHQDDFIELSNSKGGKEECFFKPTYELCISCDNIVRFSECVFLKNVDKLKKIEKIVSDYKQTPNRTQFIDRVVKKTNERIEDVYDCTVPNISAFDANGVYVHNCVEIGLYPVDEETGETGWEACNLCEINGKKCSTKEDFAIACKAAAIIGTCQAGYSDLTYLGLTSKKILEREALLGVSITGMMDNPEILLNPEIQREMAKLILDVNEEIAKKIGINPTARANCIKPAGCQRPDTLIVSENGILQLGEIGDIEGEQWQEHDLKVFNGEKHTKSNKFYVNGFHKSKKIKMRSGLELESTYNHKYKVLRNDNLEWVRADEIKNGDIIPYVVGDYYKSSNEGYLKSITDLHTGSNWVKSPFSFDVDLCWFLGLYTGSGINYKDGVKINVNKNNLEYLQRTQKIIFDQFGLSSNIVKDDKDENKIILEINELDFVCWLELNYLIKSNSKNTNIPKVIRTLKPELLKSFIDGYWCANGHLNPINDTRNWVVTSKNISQQIVTILRALGQDCYVKEIPDGDSSKDVKYLIQEKKGRKGNYDNSSFYNEYKLLDKCGLNSYTPDLVVSVEDSFCLTLDIEVPEDHAYLANSYVSHNTTSCILGTASGIHPHHAMRYIRRSQGNYLEPPLQHFKKINPIAVEKSVWSANGTDEVVAFCVEVPRGAKTKNDIDALILLELVKLTQENWVMAGTRKERCTQPWLTHNVSNTITVRDDEWDSVTNYIYDNRNYFCGISLLPISGDKDYPQAPFTAIYTPQEITKMYGDGSLMASGLIVDGLSAFNNNLWSACDAVLGRGMPLNKPDDSADEKTIKEWELKVDWIRRANQFSERYFNGNVKEMTYCLKDVANWKYWCDLKREYKDIDFSTMIEEEDKTKTQQEWACSGGQCSIDYA